MNIQGTFIKPSTLTFHLQGMSNSIPCFPWFLFVFASNTCFTHLNSAFEHIHLETFLDTCFHPPLNSSGSHFKMGAWAQVKREIMLNCPERLHCFKNLSLPLHPRTVCSSHIQHWAGGYRGPCPQGASQRWAIAHLVEGEGKMWLNEFKSGRKLRRKKELHKPVAREVWHEPGIQGLSRFQPVETSWNNTRENLGKGVGYSELCEEAPSD